MVTAAQSCGGGDAGGAGPTPVPAPADADAAPLAAPVTVALESGSNRITASPYGTLRLQIRPLKTLFMASNARLAN